MVNISVYTPLDNTMRLIDNRLTSFLLRTPLRCLCQRKTRQGFTLIELLVVIAVMGVLATVVLVAVNPTAQFAKVRDTQRKSDIRNIKNALESYFIATGAYPNTGSAWIYSRSADPWIPGLETEMKQIPVDPLNTSGSPWRATCSTCYQYAYRSNGVFYDLVSRLESSEDPDRCELKRYRFGNSACTGGVWCGRYSGQIFSTNSCDT